MLRRNICGGAYKEIETAFALFVAGIGLVTGADGLVRVLGKRRLMS